MIGKIKGTKERGCERKVNDKNYINNGKDCSDIKFGGYR